MDVSIADEFDVDIFEALGLIERKGECTRHNRTREVYLYTHIQIVLI